jgi:hypothetical protein
MAHECKAACKFCGGSESAGMQTLNVIHIAPQVGQPNLNACFRKPLYFYAVRTVKGNQMPKQYIQAGEMQTRVPGTQEKILK